MTRFSLETERRTYDQVELQLLPIDKSTTLISEFQHLDRVFELVGQEHTKAESLVSSTKDGVTAAAFSAYRIFMHDLMLWLSRPETLTRRQLALKAALLRDDLKVLFDDENQGVIRLEALATEAGHAGQNLEKQKAIEAIRGLFPNQSEISDFLYRSWKLDIIDATIARGVDDWVTEPTGKPATAGPANPAPRLQTGVTVMSMAPAPTKAPTPSAYFPGHEDDDYEGCLKYIKRQRIERNRAYEAENADFGSDLAFF